MLTDRAVLYLAFGQTFLWAGMYYIFPALFLRWEQEFDWSKAEITGAITIAILISALCSPIAGRIIDKGNGALMMFSTSVLGGLCLILLSFVNELKIFYICWGLIGICMAGCLYDPCFTFITRQQGDQARRSIIIVTLIAGFAGTISFPAAHSIAEFSNWNNVCRFFALIIMFLAAPLTLTGARRLEQSKMPEQQPPAHIPTSGYRFVRRPGFWLLAFAFAMMALLHGMTIHHLLPLLDDRGVRADIAVIAASFIGPMQVMGRLAMMAMEKQASNHQITVSCFLITGCSIGILFYSAFSSTVLVGFVVLFGAGYGIVSILRPVIAQDLLGGHNFGAKYGLLSAIYLAASALSPYLGSVLWTLGGYDLVLLILVGCGLTGLWLYMLANRLTQRQSV